LIGAVHACIGACVGSFFKNKGSALAAGVVSHAVADVIPHKDFDPVIEAPLLVATLWGIAKWRGVDSPEFCGAIGAISPDIEHGLGIVGLITNEQKVFPTHVSDGILHGPESDERWSQLIIATASLITVAVRGPKSRFS